MTQVNLSMSISADGFVAGPNQNEDNPLGEGGLALHAWHLGDQAEHPVNKQVADEMMEGFGAFIMGRNMYGPIRGEWGDTVWKGWWGDDPPYHAPTYVLTHHAHDPIEMEGGTTFHFVTDGVESAFAQARELRETRRSRSPEEPHALSRPWPPASSTSSIFRFPRSSSARARDCSTTSSPARRRSSSWSGSSRRRASRTSGTA